MLSRSHPIKFPSTRVLPDSTKGGKYSGVTWYDGHFSNVDSMWPYLHIATFDIIIAMLCSVALTTNCVCPVNPAIGDTINSLP
ncbi:MAG: hypothetical protein IPO26_21700 [Saprospiraceae bacterium]|nr:hypothetical protein [Saprospiraceae bacterium]